MTISGSSVLIIDDDENVGEVLSDIFLEKGCTVIVARNGLEALTKAKETSFDISLIDLELPDINGIGVLKKLKKDNPEKLYYIITGYASLQTAVSALNDGANGYFLKPLIIEELMHHILGEIEKMILKKNLEESEENYKKAYNRVNFYKDLFTHDINNVLNNISIAMKLFTEYVDNIENRNTYLNIMDEVVKRGKLLVNNVRKLSQLEEKEISVEPIDFLDVLIKTIEFTKQNFKTKEISIQTNILVSHCMIFGNELLSDVFENLLINAIGHNVNPVIYILIRVSKEKRGEANYIKFQFIDNGIGIEDERKEKIFDGEYISERKTKGMGFGLSLVKKILLSYNGFIRVENKDKRDFSRGSNFIILIPEAE